jgi:hypothetical protein
MKEVYRIKKGNLSIQTLDIPFDFGLVFEEEGIFYIDVYVAEQFDLLSFMNNKEKIYLNDNFFLKAKTDKKNELEATELSLRNITPHQSFIKLQSYGFIKHTEVRENYVGKEKEDNTDQMQTLFFLEIEGLRIEYTDLTETIKARGGVKINEFNDWERDHTSAVLIYNSPTKIGYNNFKFTFFPCESGNNIYVELPNYRDNGPNVLFYDVYKEFKRDLVFFLSFLNGAEVAIRKEFIGGFYNIGKVNSQTIISYSFKTIKTESYNKYIPLNNPFNRVDHILGYAFIHCFNQFVLENKKLDLNSIIFYLNGAEQAGSIEEKFFVQIIAFERLAQKYVESIENSDSFIIDDSTYKPIKDELLLVLNKYSKGNLKNSIDNLKGKIGDLNKVKRTSTEYKFKKLLEYSKINITPEIQVIIDEARHKSVHHGEIGQGNDGIKNYLVLDELLRDIILNIINYDRARISRYRYKSEKTSN